MTRHNPETRRLLAAEYVLGTLRGRARRRFERLRADDAAYCQDADDWESRFGHLAEALPGIEPPDRVWDAIARETRPRRGGAGLWERLGLWRALAIATSAAAAALLLVILWPGATQDTLATSHIAMLDDADARPAWLFRLDAEGRHATIQPLEVALPGAGKAYELWLVPGDGRPPVSLGLVAAGETRRIDLNGARVGPLSQNPALAISLEPAGGSPTGQPTGPVQFQGRLAALP